MGITKRGATWEWLNSWWMLFIFMPFAITSFFAFLFIGIRVRNRNWIMYGIIYFLLFAFGFVLPDTPGAYHCAPFVGGDDYSRVQSAAAVLNSARRV